MSYGYRDKKIKRYKHGFTCLLTVLCVYFSSHLFFSDRSVFAMVSSAQEQVQLQDTLNQLTEKRDGLLRVAVGLRPETIDPDLVDEYAIKMLGHSISSSMIIVDDIES